MGAEDQSRSGRVDRRQVGEVDDDRVRVTGQDAMQLKLQATGVGAIKLAEQTDDLDAGVAFAAHREVAEYDHARPRPALSTSSVIHDPSSRFMRRYGIRAKT